MILSVVNVVMATKGAFRYDELMNMELARFFEVVKGIQISNSAENNEQFRAENHERAVNGTR